MKSDEPDTCSEGGPPRRIGGTCLCGEVAFEFDGPVLEFELDHCSRCRKATGSAFASELQVALESFRWLRGRANTRIYRAPILRSPPAYERWFCASCGGPVPKEIAGVVLIPAGLLDVDPVTRPTRHIFVGGKAAWFGIHDDLPRFQTKP
jgi:hypothetical protein